LEDLVSEAGRRRGGAHTFARRPAPTLAQDQTAGGAAQPGQEVDMTVTLQPGSYEIWCPVANHRALGMTSTFTVS
jgi:uncharacterized cupredoxin-like copper-binding protein